MRKLYRYLGLKKSRRSKQSSIRGKDGEVKSRGASKSKKFKWKDFGIDMLTAIDRVQINYSEGNSSFLPGYLPSPGFLGTLRPTAG